LASKAKTKSSQIGDPFQIFALLRGGPDAKGAGGGARRHPKRFVTICCRGGIARRDLLGADPLLLSLSRLQELLLLTRPGYVSNLGDNTFQLAFKGPLDEYEVVFNPKMNQDGLRTGEKLPGGSIASQAADDLFLRTTYLSERLWIIRDIRDPSIVSVFERTNTYSVFDRRGLVMEKQLKPSDNEQVRYGALLFGDTKEDYQGWAEKAAQAEETKNKLLGR
jgi:hypothetical protein